MKPKGFYESFNRFVAAAPVLPIEDDDRIVFLSDLHLGDGGPQDDLVHNRCLLETAMEEWYLERNYTLVLNGDIEDLNKFVYEDISRAWQRLFGIFDEFRRRGRLRKIVGNHDLGLLRQSDYPYELAHNAVFEYRGNRIVAFHGHQASRLFVKFDYLAEFIVRYLAKPLRMRNTSIVGDSRRQFAAERRIYRAARALGIVAITGHTHRPLFDSLSKYDSLRWSIERLFEEYAYADADHRRLLTDLIVIYKQEIERLKKRDLRRETSRGIYCREPLLIPCLFNSGCATGKHGITAIEIDRGVISLVHWADNHTARAYIRKESLSQESLEGGDTIRFTLKAENLDLVFARISILGGGKEA